MLRRGLAGIASRLPAAVDALAACREVPCGALAASTQLRPLSTTSSSAAVHLEDEPYCRQRQIVILGNRVPVVAPDTWLADNSILIGDVDLFEKASLQLCRGPRGKGGGGVMILGLVQFPARKTRL